METTTGHNLARSQAILLLQVRVHQPLPDLRVPVDGRQEGPTRRRRHRRAVQVTVTRRPGATGYS
jgi:hypothetical protein